MTFSKNDTQHKNALHYAECCILFKVMPSVIMVNVLMLSLIYKQTLYAACRSTLNRPVRDKHSNIFCRSIIDKEEEKL
jgi:hypothetical protein